MMKSRVFNCPKCKRKECVKFEEHPSLEYGSTCCSGGGYLYLRIFQWRCGFCGYNKVKLSINNNDKELIFE